MTCVSLTCPFFSVLQFVHSWTSLTKLLNEREQTEWTYDALRHDGDGPDKKVQLDFETVETKIRVGEKYGLFWKLYVPYQEHNIAYWMQ